MSSTPSFKSPSIFVGSLSSNTSGPKLLQLFGKFGCVASIRLCDGYAIINYNNINDAEKAIKTMNFRFINGKQCHVMWYQKNHRKVKKCGESNIFVKNLDESVDNKILYDTFNVFGEILSCKVMINKMTNKSLGYGYIQFADIKAAQNAINGVNGIKILNRPIIAQPFIPRHERIKTQRFTNVYVKYIPQSFDEQTLKDLFEKETNGTITNSFFCRKPFGISACLNFSNPNHAKIAIQKLNRRNINGYQLYVTRAQKKSQRQRKNQNKRRHKYNNYPYRQTTFRQRFNHQPQAQVKNEQSVNAQHIINNGVPFCVQPNALNINGLNGQQIPVQYIQPQSVPMQYIQPQPTIYQTQAINNGIAFKQYSVPISCIHSQPIYNYVSQPNYSVPNVSQPMISAPMKEKEPLTLEQLSNIDKETRKNMIGERLFAQIQSIEPRLAGKITGMLLELDNKELLMMLNDRKKLCQRINEALVVLKQYQKQKSISNTSNNESAPNSI